MQIILQGAGVSPMKLFDASQHKGKKYGLLLQVVDNINVWVSTNPSELEQADYTAGNPSGLLLAGAATPPAPTIIPEFADVLWGISSAKGRINVMPYMREL